MRRWIVLLFVLVLIFPFFKESAWAQRSGAGTFSGPGMCSDVVGQITGQTFCFDQTSGSLNVWNGSTYSALSGYLTVPTSSLTLFAASSIGIGQAAPTTVGELLAVSKNYNGDTNIQVSNTTSGTNAATTIYLGNDTTTPGLGEYGAIQLTSTGWTAGGPMNVNNQFFVSTSAKNGMTINSAGTGPINYWINGAQIGQMLDTGNVGLNIMTGSYFLGGLNMFQTGTWTPTFQCSTTNPSTPGSDAEGWWIGVGNMVWFQGHMGWGTVSGGSGTAMIGGFPFNVIDSSGGEGGVLVSDLIFDNATPAAGGTRLMGRMNAGAKTMNFLETNYGTMGMLNPAPCANVYPSTPSNARFNGWYRYQ